MSSPDISIIIPTMNEAEQLGCAIESCHGEGACEVVVVDGGSGDATVDIAREGAAEVIVVSPAQRARQMNAGAASAKGEVLVFLHADSHFVPGALASLRETVRTTSAVGGGFSRRFQTGSLLLKTSCLLGNGRGKYFGWYFGDQAIWARRESFEKAGGFPEKPIFEDLDFSRNLRRLGPTAHITPGIVTSARRYQNAPASRLAKDFLLTIRHICPGRGRP